MRFFLPNCSLAIHHCNEAITAQEADVSKRANRRIQTANVERAALLVFSLMRDILVHKPTDPISTTECDCRNASHRVKPRGKKVGGTGLKVTYSPTRGYQHFSGTVPLYGDMAYR